MLQTTCYPSLKEIDNHWVTTTNMSTLLNMTMNLGKMSWKLFNLYMKHINSANEVHNDIAEMNLVEGCQAMKSS